jgi:23S rRNA (guanine745-N1)-methyltransferase
MQGHAYDKAKSGYVNLLVGSSTKSHGDDEDMVNSRTRFLSKGYYKPLENRLIELIGSLKITSLVDLGCGEGTYTNAIQEALNIPVIGIDLSKAALKTASKSNKKVVYALANITKAPLSDQDTDAVLSVFSPIDLSEVKRIGQRFLILVQIILSN